MDVSSAKWSQKNGWEHSLSHHSTLLIVNFFQSRPHFNQGRLNFSAKHFLPTFHLSQLLADGRDSSINIFLNPMSSVGGMTIVVLESVHPKRKLVLSSALCVATVYNLRWDRLRNVSHSRKMILLFRKMILLFSYWKWLTMNVRFSSF